MKKNLEKRKRIDFYLDFETYQLFINFLIKKYGSKDFVLAKEIRNAILFYIKNNENSFFNEIENLKNEIKKLKNEIEFLKNKKIIENNGKEKIENDFKIIPFNKEEIKKENNFKIKEINNMPSFLKDNPWIEILKDLPYLNER